MPDFTPPFKFDFRAQLEKARRKTNSRVGSVSISLPFISFTLNPDDLEVNIAKEIIIRMADKRVLNACECCDDCINRAISSLLEIRSMLVDKQVELKNYPDSPLYLLIELQTEAIRQFLTFEQKLSQSEKQEPFLIDVLSDLRFIPTPSVREQYLAGLEMLRSHLFRCLIQISKIAGITIPKISESMRYEEAWQVEAYEQND